MHESGRSNTMYRVIMGDIINSRNLEPEVRERVTQVAKREFDWINIKYMGSMLASFGMVRGDSFEGVLITQSYAPQIVQDIIKAIYSVEKTLVRISVVLGKLTVTSHDRNEVDGPAFVEVMDALERLKARGSKHWLQVSIDIGTLGDSLISSQVELLTALSEKWTERQREICWIAEEIEGQEHYPKDTKKQELYKLVAKRLGVTPAVVRKHLNAALYEAYRMGWDGITEYLADMDGYAGDENAIVPESYVPHLNIGLRRFVQRNFVAATYHLERALELAKDEFGEDSNQIIPLYIHLADSYSGISKIQEAEEATHKAMSLHKNLNMPNTQPQYFDILLTLAQVHISKREFKQAKKIIEETFSAAEKILHPTHPHWSILFHTMASVHYHTNDYANALIYYEKAQATLIYKPDSIDYSINTEGIAMCYYHMGNYDKALSLAQDAQKIYDSTLSPEHELIIDNQVFIDHIQQAQKGEKK